MTTLLMSQNTAKSNPTIGTVNLKSQFSEIELSILSIILRRIQRAMTVASTQENQPSHAVLLIERTVPLKKELYGERVLHLYSHSVPFQYESES